MTFNWMRNFWRKLDRSERTGQPIRRRPTIQPMLELLEARTPATSLTLFANPLNVVEGQFAMMPFSLTDSDGNTNPSQYNISINWGDGSSPSSAYLYWNSASNNFQTMMDGHTYTEEGSYNIGITVTDSNGDQAFLQETAHVSDAPLSPGMNMPLYATAGQLFNGTEAYFSDANPYAQPGDFTATINWGDGSPNSVATVTGGGMGEMGGGSSSFMVSASHTYANGGNYPITVTVQDDGGGSLTMTNTAYVTSPPPTAANDSYSIAHDHTLSVAASGVLANDTSHGQSLSAVLGMSTMHGMVNLHSDGSFTYTPNTGYVGTDAFSYHAVANGQQSNWATVTLTVYAPSINNPGSQSNAEGNAVSLQITANNTTGSPFIYGASGMPSGLTIDSTSGLIQGTLAYTDAETQGGSYSVTVTGANSLGDSSSKTFQWYVSNTNPVPTLPNPGDQSNTEGDGVALPLSASTVDGGTLTYSASGLPDGININAATGLISGIVAADAGGNHAVTVTASEGTQSASQSFHWNVSNVFLSSQADQSNLDGDAVSLPMSAYTTSGQPLTFTAAGLPSGLAIDSHSGLISGTVGANDSVSGPYAATVTASDATDSASTSFTWNITHLAVQNPGDQTNAEGDAVSLAIGVSDNASDTLTFGASGLPNGLSIDAGSGLITGTVQVLDAENSPYAVTVTASSGSATDSQTFNWTITHIQLADPGSQIDAPGDTVNLAIHASDPDGHSLTLSAAGLPAGLSINSTTGIITGVVSSTAGSDTPYNVVLSASNGTETATLPVSWTVTNGAVAVTNPGAQTNAEGATVTLAVSASDSGGQPLTFSAVGLPAGLDIDPGSGVISGTVDDAAAETNGGVYAVTVAADDGQGDNGSQSFTWTITHTNQAPVFSNPGDQLTVAGTAVTLPLDAYDPDGDAVSYTATGLPAGLTIDGSAGVISGAPTTPGDCTVTVSASDGSLTTSQTFNWDVTNNQVTITNPGDQSNAEADVVSLQIAATFPPGQSASSFVAAGLPTGLTINSSGLIAGTISYSAAEDQPGGIYSVTVVAADASGDSGGVQFEWDVSDTIRPPTLTAPAAQTVAEGSAVSLQIQASSPDGETLTYAAGGLPAGLSIDQDTGLISGTVAYGAAHSGGGHYTTALTVQDDAGHTVSQSFQWTVTAVETTPWIVAPTPALHVVGDTVSSLKVYAGDPDGDPLTYSAVGLPAGLGIDANTGIISGNLTQAGSFNVTVKASDGNLYASATFTWNVTANTPEVTLAINGTLDTSDDVALLGAAPISVVVTLQQDSPGMHEVTLQLPGASYDLSSLSQTAFPLGVGGSATVMLTALQGSAIAGDVQLLAFADGQAAGAGKLTNENVTIPRHITATDTPAGMADRIPPRKVSQFAVSLSVALPMQQEISFEVQGQSADYGMVKLVDATNAETDRLHTNKQGDYVIQIKGAVDATTTMALQTMRTPDDEGASNAGHLQLIAYVGQNKTSSLKSDGFSVAAIPYAFSEKFLGTALVTIDKVEYVVIEVADSWKSDSGEGNIQDLGQCEVRESVQQVSVEGVFKDATGKDAEIGTSGYFDADTFSSDKHGFKRFFLKAPGGKSEVNQLSLFCDHRTRSKDIVMADSGYKVTEEVSQDPKTNKWGTVITKVGAKVTVKDQISGENHTSEAGATDQEKIVGKYP